MSVVADQAGLGALAAFAGGLAWRLLRLAVDAWSARLAALEAELNRTRDERDFWRDIALGRQPPQPPLTPGE